MTDAAPPQLSRPSSRALSLKIVDPCPVKGIGFSRRGKHYYCQGCNKTVHDFSKMSRLEIYHAFLTNRETGVCGRIRYDDSGAMIYRRWTPRYLVRCGYQKVLGLGIVLYGLFGARESEAALQGGKAGGRAVVSELVPGRSVEDVVLLGEAKTAQGPLSFIPGPSSYTEHAEYGDVRNVTGTDVLLTWIMGAYAALLMIASFVCSLIAVGTKRWRWAVAFLIIAIMVFLTREVVAVWFNDAAAFGVLGSFSS